MHFRSHLPSLKTTIIGLVWCFIFVMLLGSWLASENIGEKFIQSCGLLGLYGGLVVIDSVPSPGGGIPLMALSIQGGVSPWIVLFISLAGVTTVSMISYIIGYWTGMPSRIEAWMDKKFPGKLLLLKQKGTLGVAALAALPIPLSMGTGAAGALRLPFLSSVFTAVAIRCPKIIFYLWTIIGGFELLL